MWTGPWVASGKITVVDVPNRPIYCDFLILYAQFTSVVASRSLEIHELDVRIRYATRDEVGVTVRYWVCNRELTVSKARKTTDYTA